MYAKVQNKMTPNSHIRLTQIPLRRCLCDERMQADYTRRGPNTELIGWYQMVSRAEYSDIIHNTSEIPHTYNYLIHHTSKAGSTECTTRACQNSDSVSRPHSFQRPVHISQRGMSLTMYALRDCVRLVNSFGVGLVVS